MLGHLWYGPLFNDLWIEYYNLSPRTRKRLEKKGHGAEPIVCLIYIHRCMRNYTYIYT